MNTRERSRIVGMGLTASAALAGMTGAGVRAEAGAASGVLDAIMVVAAGLATGRAAIATTPDTEARSRVLEWDKRCVLITLGCAAAGGWAQAHGSALAATMWGVIGMGAVLGALIGGWRMAQREDWVDPAELLMARAGTRATGRALASAGTDKIPFGEVFDGALARIGASRRAGLKPRYERWVEKITAGEGAWAEWWEGEMRDAVRGRSLTRWDLRARAGTQAQLDAIDAHVRRSLARGWWSEDAHISKSEAGTVVARERGRTGALCRRERARWKANERGRARTERWVAGALGAGALGGTIVMGTGWVGWTTGSAATAAMALSAMARARGARAGRRR